MKRIVNAALSVLMLLTMTVGAYASCCDGSPCCNGMACCRMHHHK